MTEAPAATHALNQTAALHSGRRAVAAAAVGNALEWYDFTVYAFFAVYIAQSFFSGADETAQLLSAFLAFGLGFVVRPLGALLIGVYADRAGRKAALTLTIMTMAVGTLVIAVAPTYAAIGIGAPLLIVVGRMLQGFSAGGEIGGAAAFLVEHAPPDRKGKYAAWLQASMGISNIMGALVATVVSMTFTQPEIAEWAWRIPFIIGLLIAPVGLYMRSTLDETPVFIADQQRQRRSGRADHAPLMNVIRHHPRTLVVGTAFSILWAVSVYTLIIYMPTYAQKTLGLTSTQSFLASLIGNIFMVVGCVVAGIVSDRLGRRRVLAVGAALLLVAAYPLLWLLQAAPSAGLLIAVQIVFCLLTAIFTGVAPAALAEIFPTAVRSTGMSLSYNIAVTIFGGFAPAILTWMMSQTGRNDAPAFYVMVAAAIALIAIAKLPPPVKD